MGKQILVADDEVITTEIIRDELTAHGFSVLTATNGQQAWEQLERNQFDVLLLDIKMPYHTGMELIQKAKISSPNCSIIIMTAFGTVESAVNAIKAGADDFLAKPFDLDILINKLLQLPQEGPHATAQKPQSASHLLSDTSLLGESAAIQEIRKKIEKIKDVSSTVLITGESGTGKSFIAHEIHRLSLRGQEPFVLVDCATLPPALIESELFGHERGAFTGAVNRKPGKFEQAKNGTVFLDEISCLPLPLQSKLLTVLQERTFCRVGGTEKIEVAARVIAATNENLETAVAQGKFRSDLYYRLNVVNIEIPPLRSRKEDILLLAQYFIARFSKRSGMSAYTVENSFLESLTAYEWPGNVRELENAIESSILLCNEGVLTANDLPLRITSSAVGTSQTRSIRRQQAEGKEKAQILAALDACGGHRAKTAELLNISRRTLQYKLKKWNLT